MKQTDDQMMSYHAGRSGSGSPRTLGRSAQNSVQHIGLLRLRRSGSAAKMKPVAMPMKASASVKAIPMHISDLQAAGELGLAGDALDRLADDDADADGRADRREAVADGGDVAGDLGENGSCVHVGFPFLGMFWAGARAQCSSATASWM